jgi:catechol 2,3-dioxygenase-like lactoylglutathione lyase family enzyme
VRGGAGEERRIEVTDPEGHVIQFVQPPRTPPKVASNSLSEHMIHFGLIVHDRAREDGFYRGVLGFRPYWAGGMKDDVPTWISLQLPDGRDWIEYMIVGAPEGRGPPPGMSRETLGVFNHFALGVANAEAAYTRLWTGDRLGPRDEAPKIGRDAKWQVNLYDPDGTRAELMEFHAVGKPCCSPFTAPDPDR